MILKGKTSQWVVRLISGEVAALRLPGGWRIVLDPVRPNESPTGSKP